MSKTLRDEIATYISAQSYSAPFDGGITATRANLMLTDLEETNQVTVTVLPGTQMRERDVRTGFDKIWQVYVVVQEKIDLNTAAARFTREDALMQLSNEIAEYMEVFEGPVTRQMVDEFEERPPFDPEDLEAANLMTIPIILKFREYAT